jgi:hypothetical protein
MNRARWFRVARIAVLVLVIGFFLAPYGLRSWIPVWLLFLLALTLEVDFFVGGWLRSRRETPAEEAPDRGPQQRDLSELGSWGYWDPREPTPPVVAEPSFRWINVVEAVGVLAVIAVLLYAASRPRGWDAVSAERQAQTETILSREASTIARHPATVTCDDSREFVGFVQDADGLAEVGGEQAYLTPEICDTLYQLAIKHRVQSFSATGRAIAVLAHEAWHLRGERNEGLANCYGFQSGVQIGRNLGLSESRARAMMREQYATNASDSGTNVQYRVPADCRRPYKSRIQSTSSSRLTIQTPRFLYGLFARRLSRQITGVTQVPSSSLSFFAWRLAFARSVVLKLRCFVSIMKTPVGPLTRWSTLPSNSWRRSCCTVNSAGSSSSASPTASSDAAPLFHLALSSISR